MDGIVEGVVKVVVKAAFYLVYLAVRLALIIVGLLLSGLGWQSRALAAKKGRSLATMGLRQDILDAVQHLEYAGRREFVGLNGGPTQPAGMLMALPQLLAEDEWVLTVRATQTGLAKGMQMNIGILAVTDRRVLFNGIRGGAEFPREAIDAAEGWKPAVFIANSALRIAAHGGDMHFSFLRQSAAGADIAGAIMAMRQTQLEPVRSIAASVPPRQTLVAPTPMGAAPEPATMPVRASSVEPIPGAP